MKKLANELLNSIDGSGSEAEDDAVDELSKLGNEFPILLFEKFQNEKSWRARNSCVYHAIRYARNVDEAVKLGIMALFDKSKAVRFRGCMLLAYSLRKDCLSDLRRAESIFKDEETIENILAAIDAIENDNSNYFVDRNHTGKLFFEVL